MLRAPQALFFCLFFNYRFNDRNQPEQYNAGSTKRRVKPMRQMTPKDKMSRKARKEMNAEKRNLWTMNPVTRIRESGKIYNRKRLRAIPDE